LITATLPLSRNSIITIKSLTILSILTLSQLISFISFELIFGFIFRIWLTALDFWMGFLLIFINITFWTGFAIFLSISTKNTIFSILLPVIYLYTSSYLLDIAGLEELSYQLQMQHLSVYFFDIIYDSSFAVSPLFIKVLLISCITPSAIFLFNTIIFSKMDIRC
jgi:hypothetical protein